LTTDTTKECSLCCYCINKSTLQLSWMLICFKRSIIGILSRENTVKYEICGYDFWQDTIMIDCGRIITW